MPEPKIAAVSIQRRVGITAAALCLMLLATTSDATAGLDVENVLVAVNANDETSQQIAAEFVKLRGIPELNVVELENVPEGSTSTVEAFREQILLPIRTAMTQREIDAQISCIAYSSGFPTAYRVNGDLPDGKRTSKVLTPVASLTGLTFLYEQVEEADIDYLSLTANRMYRRPTRLAESIRLTAEDAATLNEVGKLMSSSDWDDAAQLLKDLAERHPEQSIFPYQLACCLAKAEKPEEAIKQLQNASEAGWWNAGMARRDQHLVSLREREDFKAWLASLEPPLFEVQPSLRIEPGDRWAADGTRSDEGRRYLLSTMLSVTAENGLNLDESLELLRRSKSADGTHPTGTVHYIVNKNIRSRTRQPLFASAIAALDRLGVKAEATNGLLPKERDDVIGLMAGSAIFDWPASKSKMKPGAIAEHLTSFGGVFGRKNGQTQLTEFLRHGAAGSSGTVTEPYAIPNKFPNPFLHVHYAAGCTLAEAFYQSVHGPYQLLVVGDPLCRPWADEVALQIDIDSPAPDGDGSIAVSVDAENLPEVPTGIAIYLDGKWTAQSQPGQSIRLPAMQPTDTPRDISAVARFENRTNLRARGFATFGSIAD
ncbi:TPR end-of-group domain-containing protein [Stratiformator vulcanicus]|uniref:Tetratricopeptide repeat protein n=1 Tax=Stratiformator vulcanicus TaxID=2527980 RepID=A0A517R794_9PLAN|nr:hypothetical protein [Stratiformator vulcanicus]QDT39691.1 hypothetical protein Pan189_41000 [Stratiformator vulcanicus]